MAARKAKRVVIGTKKSAIFVAERYPCTSAVGARRALGDKENETEVGKEDGHRWPRHAGMEGKVREGAVLTGSFDRGKKERQQQGRHLGGPVELNLAKKQRPPKKCVKARDSSDLSAV